jgi:hypothetical protein
MDIVSIGVIGTQSSPWRSTARCSVPSSGSEWARTIWASFSQGFGVAAAALVGYAILGLVGRKASPVWAFGIMILALNFGVWSWALHLLL